MKKRDVYIKEWVENQEKRPRDLKDVIMPRLKIIGFENGLN